jgi:hypothetical protein
LRTNLKQKEQWIRLIGSAGKEIEERFQKFPRLLLFDLDDDDQEDAH